MPTIAKKRARKQIEISSQLPSIYKALLLLILFAFVVFFSYVSFFHQKPQTLPQPEVLPTQDPSSSPSASPTARPLTFEEMNQQFGPCAYVPTLMYHHIEPLDLAEQEGHKQLTVGDVNFRGQMEYVRKSNHSIISMQQLIEFFDAGMALPQKPLLLTFDDGYSDFATYAAPILKEYGFAATVFVPTGLIENAGYMNWSAVENLGHSGGILMSNHTWSHHSVAEASDMIEKEITTADNQLVIHSLNTPKVFAYPYGVENETAETILGQKGYLLAFTTQQGSTLCKQKRLTLPRIRIGNAPLSSYGL